MKQNCKPCENTTVVSPAREEVAALSERLGLIDASQDWGIENADASRLDEFVTLYTDGALTQAQRYAMAELVLASANEVLCVEPQADLGRVVQLLPQVATDAQPEFDYWKGLNDEEEFPLGRWLRERT